MTPQSTGVRHGRISTQPGSNSKRWNREELRTTEPRRLNLRGKIHPVFSNWKDLNRELRRELKQPLLLASRLLEAAGLPWASDFLAHDVFVRGYPGRKPSCRCSFTHSAAARADDNEMAPRTVVRHHRAVWASSHLKGRWTRAAESKLRGEVSSSVRWELDEDMFRERGWAGYTCRHPRNGQTLDELDRYETIRRWDKKCEARGRRNMSILVTAEFPKRLAQLRCEGKGQGEEYLLTAFMTAITLLHELGHAIYWKDCRALTRDLREPFYGADLEMELGDSFVASIFGGWIPVQIKNIIHTKETLGFSAGIAWKQVLSWDFHRLRPKHRAHYSIPVDYVSRLFSEEDWLASRKDLRSTLIRPQTLEPALKDVGICAEAAAGDKHATAAVADFHYTGQGWVWNRLAGARFRIPQYDGYLCPDLDLPIATDDVIEEPKPRPQLKPSPMPPMPPPLPPPTAITSGESIPSSSLSIQVKLDMFPQPPRKPFPKNNNNSKKKKPGLVHDHIDIIQMKKQTPGFVRLVKEEQQQQQQQNPLSPDKSSEISLDELRSRLSQLLGVSFDELERFLEAPRCV
ncbi:uncharacterized protein F4812DRAFT_456743 [Daldinia caldariorum]|uniref:uncharacterized protein n=1 Tax=Daldinia caldariorum TaxID=326644 RepID=UPI00200831AD|nr:uncharacterized protein F4812DRAFT_456743 [Daldinia caldariorum]KAI1470731.1 hypothetical protein F4812DRAFT_456743 [Daldinia caldariorum]